jgi:hypothetical protein
MLVELGVLESVGRAVGAVPPDANRTASRTMIATTTTIATTIHRHRRRGVVA